MQLCKIYILIIKIWVLLICQIISAIIKADPMTIINNLITITILLVGVLASMADYIIESTYQLCIFLIYDENKLSYYEKKKINFYERIYKEIKRQSLKFTWNNIWNTRPRGYFTI